MTPKTKIQIILAIIILSISGFIYLYSNQDKVLEVITPTWQGEYRIDKLSGNYIVEGIIAKENTTIGYTSKSTISYPYVDFIYLNTNHGIIKVSILDFKEQHFYKRCNFEIGNNVRYIGTFSGAFDITIKENHISHFVLKRELC